MQDVLQFPAFQMPQRPANQQAPVADRRILAGAGHGDTKALADTVGQALDALPEQFRLHQSVKLNLTGTVVVRGILGVWAKLWPQVNITNARGAQMLAQGILVIVKKRFAEGNRANIGYNIDPAL